MSVPWYEWRNIRSRLMTFGKAVQGVSPYRVVIQPDPAKCPSGYCNFTGREIAANPALFAALPKDQYQLTKAVLVHEAGHRRFTVPCEGSPVVHRVANILEDERIERLMCEEFAGVRWLVWRLSQRLYDEAVPVDPDSGSPAEIVAYFLQLRWAKRIGHPIKGGLSNKNQELWKVVEPLVYQSWSAESSETVDSNAEAIVKILGIEDKHIPEWVKDMMGKLGPVEGSRSEKDRAEKISVGPQHQEGHCSDEDEPEPFDGDVPPNDSRVGEGHATIDPKPYISLEESVAPLVTELVDELSVDERPQRWEPVERGGRLSVREYLRDHGRPFLANEQEARHPASLALKVIIDHSGSLNHRSDGKTRIQSVAEAVMALHLVAVQLDIPHEVIVAPQQVRIADQCSSERGKALIAGVVPARCGYEDMGLAIKNHAVPMVSYRQDIRLVICLTDGACNDANLAKETCRALRGKVEVIGILLDPDESTKVYVNDIFGQDRVIACHSEELPAKLGNILRAVQGV